MQKRPVMKIVIFALLALELAVSGCGTSTPTNTTTTSTSGNWEALLSGGIGDASQLNFVTAFTVTNTNGGGNQPLDITGFGFINVGACFVSGETENGSANLTTGSTDQITGTMSYTVKSESPSGNTLTLTGTNVYGTYTGTTTTTGNLSNGVVTGTWTLTGGAGDSSCAGSGQFIMCQNASTCTVP